MENETGFRLDIDAAIGIAGLSKEARDDFLDFKNEYQYYYDVINSRNEMLNRDYKYVFNMDDFISFCSIKLENMKDIKIKSPLKIYYISLINHHKVFLSEMLKNKDKFYNLLHTIHCNNGFFNNSASYFAFVNYLNSIDDEEQISKIIFNLFALKKRGIFKVLFEEGLILDGNYAISVVKNTNKFKDKKQRYMVIGTLCDGEKDNYSKLGEDTYTYDAKDVKFVIKFAKGTTNDFDISICCNSLLFDPESLPSYELLHDLCVVPDIDYNKIDMECMYADLITLYDEVIKCLTECDSAIDNLSLKLKDNKQLKYYLELVSYRSSDSNFYNVINSSKKDFEDVLQSMMSKDSANKLIKTRKLERKQQEQYFEYEVVK